MHTQTMCSILRQRNFNRIARRLRQPSLHNSHLVGDLIHRIAVDAEQARRGRSPGHRPAGGDCKRRHLYRKVRCAIGVRSEISIDDLRYALPRLLNLRRRRLAACQREGYPLLIGWCAVQRVPHTCRHRHLGKKRHRADQHHHRQHAQPRHQQHVPHLLQTPPGEFDYRWQ